MWHVRSSYIGSRLRTRIGARSIKNYWTPIANCESNKTVEVKSKGR